MEIRKSIRGNESSTVLDEEIDENFVPSEEEIHEYAKAIGLDPKKDADLLWIAREGINAPLPAQWKPCQNSNGDLYFFNFTTGQSMWNHPCDEFYRKMATAEKDKRQLQPLFNAPGKTGKMSLQMPKKDLKEINLKTPHSYQVKNNIVSPLGYKPKQLEPLKTPASSLLKKLPPISVEPLATVQNAPSYAKHERSFIFNFTDDKAQTDYDFFDDIMSKDDQSKCDFNDLSSLDFDNGVADFLADEVPQLLSAKGLGSLSTIIEVDSCLEAGKSPPTENVFDSLDEDFRKSFIEDFSNHTENNIFIADKDQYTVNQRTPSVGKVTNKVRPDILDDTASLRKNFDKKDVPTLSKNNAKNLEKPSLKLEKQPVPEATKTSSDNALKDKRSKPDNKSDDKLVSHINVEETKNILPSAEIKTAKFFEKRNDAMKARQKEIEAAAEKNMEETASRLQQEVQRRSQKLRDQFLKHDERLAEMKKKQDNYLVLLKQQLDEAYDKNLTDIKSKSKQHENDLDFSLGKKLTALTNIQDSEIENWKEKLRIKTKKYENELNMSLERKMTELLKVQDSEIANLQEKHKKKAKEYENDLDSSLTRKMTELMNIQDTEIENLEEKQKARILELANLYNNKYQQMIEDKEERENLENKMEGDPKFSEKEEPSPIDNAKSSKPSPTDSPSQLSPKHNYETELEQLVRDFELRISSSEKPPSSNKETLSGLQVAEETKKMFLPDESLKLDQFHRDIVSVVSRDSSVQAAWARDRKSLDLAHKYLVIRRHSMQSKNSAKRTSPPTTMKVLAGSITNDCFVKLFSQLKGPDFQLMKQQEKSVTNCSNSCDAYKFSNCFHQEDKSNNSAVSSRPDLSHFSARSASRFSSKKIMEDLVKIDAKLSQLLNLMYTRRPRLTSFNFVPTTHSQKIKGSLESFAPPRFVSLPWHDTANLEKPSFFMGKWRYNSGRKMMEMKALEREIFAHTASL